MKVAIIAESFLPNINGVTGSVLKVLDHLAAHGDRAVVIAPAARQGEKQHTHYRGFPIVRVPAVMVPRIDSLPVGVPVPAIIRVLKSFGPDIVHLASPFVLGGAGALAARQLKLPSVAVYQTDVAGFATQYRLSALVNAAWEWTRVVHNAATVTLAPSTPAQQALAAHGVQRIHRWGRGVDTELFSPDKRCAALRRSWTRGTAETVVGFVGRLAAEKKVHRLAAIDADDRYQLVIVGDGPKKDELAAQLPGAVFTGALSGEKLARAYASFDVFCHPGEHETFCQTIQEAQASGVPVIGPNAGGPIDLIAGTGTGLLLDPDSYGDRIIGAVDTVTADRAAMSAACLERIATCTWPQVTGRLRGYYSQAIAAHADAAAGRRWGKRRPGLGILSLR
ncbi:glycosyltransferase family 4 protein [Corynebacterium mendelii]|uniref:Glycosyltransferase family 1 protein n=1 Tax=Corynebacterium mendelii TaxID=2765362 RepID=A0A939DZW6_9CORY|nr:glycosyltransferase family 1 protein [Corynebacterium mendelii]MBN9643905.1 glycosyltransferase family 1 protein [Corynebacterium mendelii]